MKRFHTSLPVSNLEQSITFYTAFFDAAPVKVEPGYAKFLPPETSLNISFHQTEALDDRTGQPHIGFEVANAKELAAVKNRLEASGLVTGDRKTSVCCYADQDKFWVSDPDGQAWEFYYVVADAEYRIDSATTCCT